MGDPARVDGETTSQEVVYKEEHQYDLLLEVRSDEAAGTVTQLSWKNHEIMDRWDKG